MYKQTFPYNRYSVAGNRISWRRRLTLRENVQTCLALFVAKSRMCYDNIHNTMRGLNPPIIPHQEFVYERLNILYITDRRRRTIYPVLEKGLESFTRAEPQSLAVGVKRISF